MRRLLLAFSGCLLILSGCSARDLVWNMFGESYSGGGVSNADRRADFDRQYDAWESSNRDYDPTRER